MSKLFPDLPAVKEWRRAIVDLDGTLCTQLGRGRYHLAEPKRDVIDRINKLYDAGWEIFIFTARGMETYAENAAEIDKKLRPLTEKWLSDNSVRYTRLMFGKPPGDFYLDDRAMTIERFMNEEID